MAKFCSNCGNEVDEKAIVCVKCGNAIGNNQGDNAFMEDKNASKGLIFGIISIFAWIIPLFGYSITIVGIITSTKGLKSQTSKGKAVAGLVLSIIFLLATITNSVIGVIMALNK